MAHVEKQIIVLNQRGFCARPAALFVKLAETFKSQVTVVKGEDRVTGKSIMGLLMLGAKYQTPLLLIVDGDDAEAAVAEFEKFFIKEGEKVYSSPSTSQYLILLCLIISLLFFLSKVINQF